MEQSLVGGSHVGACWCSALTVPVSLAMVISDRCEGRGWALGMRVCVCVSVCACACTLSSGFPFTCFSPWPGSEPSCDRLVCFSLCHLTVSAVCGGFHMSHAADD